MRPLRKRIKTLCMVLTVAMFIPTITFASDAVADVSDICDTSVLEHANYPPSSVLNSHVSSEMADCGDGDVCQFSIVQVESLNLAPYSGLNAHSIAEDRQAAATVAENYAPWSTRDAHAISEGSAEISATGCDTCVTAFGFGAETTSCDLAWDCDVERISDSRIPNEVLRQAEFATSTGC